MCLAVTERMFMASLKFSQLLVLHKTGEEQRRVRSKHQSTKNVRQGERNHGKKNKKIKIREEFLVILKSAEEPEIVFKRDVPAPHR